MPRPAGGDGTGAALAALFRGRAPGPFLHRHERARRLFVYAPRASSARAAEYVSKSARPKLLSSRTLAGRALLLSKSESGFASDRERSDEAERCRKWAELFCWGSLGSLETPYKSFLHFRLRLIRIRLGTERMPKTNFDS